MPTQRPSPLASLSTLLGSARRSPTGAIVSPNLAELPGQQLPVLGYNREDTANLARLRSLLEPEFLSRQRAQVADIERAQQGAALAGFESPQAASQYERDIERQRIEAPGRVSREQQTSITGRERAAQQSAERIARENVAAQERIAGQRYGTGVSDEFDVFGLDPNMLGFAQRVITRYNGNLGAALKAENEEGSLTTDELQQIQELVDAGMRARSQRRSIR